MGGQVSQLRKVCCCVYRRKHFGEANSAAQGKVMPSPRRVATLLCDAQKEKERELELRNVNGENGVLPLLSQTRLSDGQSLDFLPPRNKKKKKRQGRQRTATVGVRGAVRLK